MDTLTPEQRSRNMSLIHGNDTKPEVLVRKYLFSKGLRYRKNDKRLPGHPDIVLPKYKTVVFVNGCFWHGHEGCKFFIWPKSHAEYWTNKIIGNIERDQSNKKRLLEDGWTVLTVWECEIRKDKTNQRLEWLYNEIVHSSS